MAHPLRTAPIPDDLSPDVEQQSAAGAAVRIGVLVALLGGAALLAWRMGYFDLGHPQRMQAAVRRARSTAWIGPIFCAIYVGAVAFGLPITPLNIMGGAIFGFWKGAFFNWLSQVVGAAAAYWLGRGVGAAVVRRLFGRHEELLAQLRERHGFLTILRLQLIPVVPFMVTNYGAALAAVPFLPFIGGTMVGILPPTLAYSFVAERVIAGITGSETSALLWTVVTATLIVAATFAPAILKRVRGS